MGAAKHGYYPLGARPHVLALLQDPAIGFPKLVRLDPAAPAAPAAAAAPAEGQEQQQEQQQVAEGKPAGGDVEMQEAQEQQQEQPEQREGSADAPAAAAPAAADGAAAGGAAAPLLQVPAHAHVTKLPDKKWHAFVGDVAKRLRAVRRALADPNYVAPPQDDGAPAAATALLLLLPGCRCCCPCLPRRSRLAACP